MKELQQSDGYKKLIDENKQFEKSYDNFKGELSDQIQAQDNVVV
jgi:hypothetical protein